MEAQEFSLGDDIKKKDFLEQQYQYQNRYNN